MDDFHKFDLRRLERIRRWLPELYAWRNASVWPIPEWTFTATDGTETVIETGSRWPEVPDHDPIHLKATAVVPEEWAGSPVEAQMWLGGEGFVKFTPGPQVGINPFHHDWLLIDKAKGGESIEIDAEVMAKGMFGSHVHGAGIERAHLAVPYPQVNALRIDLEELVGLAEQLKKHEILPHVLDLIDDAYRVITPHWPNSTESVRARLIEGDISGGIQYSTGLGDYGRPGYRGERILGGIWHIPPASSEMAPLPQDALDACDEARAVIAKGLDELRAQYPPVGNIMLTGHAHIDLAWLWPVAETRRKARRTFSTQLWLMETYNDFIFNQSSAQAYKWIEQDDPELFTRIQRAVKDGRWEPVGGSWVEPDSQVSGGESYVRQLFYGQRYFQEKFGVRNATAWLPDVFGFSAAVPQILLGAGIDKFFTIKVTWSEANPFPYDLFMWEGLDGSRVVAHTFNNPEGGYNGVIEPVSTYNTWKNFVGKRLHDQTMLSFGWGDGGGGPSVDMLEKYARIKDYPVLPQLEMGKVEDFFNSLPVEGLPVYVGELYLELHRGTLTTQAATKRLMREGEHRLAEAEAFAALANRDGAEYPAKALDDKWEDLLYNQFHDILPGSSINEVYQDSEPQLQAVVDTAIELRDAALANRLSEGSGAWAISNPTINERPLTALLPTGANVSGAHHQEVEDGVFVHNPSSTIGAFGTHVVNGDQGSDSASTTDNVRVRREDGGYIFFDNALLSVGIGPDGTIHGIQDERVDREVFRDRGNQLWIYSDKPRAWDAWDIDETYEDIGQELTDVQSIDVVEEGPLRAAVRVTRKFRDSTIVQTYRLASGSARLDIVTHIDWHERLTLLRAQFPTTIQTHEANFETMFGVQSRPNNRNTAWERARFEVSAHRFADLSEPNYGVALLNNAKYGHSAVGGTLGISLVRGSMHPDPFADEGEHDFTYSVFPHQGNWVTGEVTAEARALNAPLVVTPVAERTESVAPFVRVDGLEVGFAALKKAHDRDGLILRIYEPHGQSGVTKLTFDRPVTAVQQVNLLEEDTETLEEVVHDGATVSYRLRPFEILSLALEF